MASTETALIWKENKLIDTDTSLSQISLKVKDSPTT